MALNQTDRHHIQMMRAAGVAYSRIAAHLDLNANSVKTYCLRHGITVDLGLPANRGHVVELPDG